ncbi:hypothetical protein H310_02254 [Aphanomyces invadans]|uniref:CBS domain-containing protein n=1 Tax=Aphanomyces invadans TaxID=157072 RepID=A0A024UNR9_9STRA|nr:hypothetical protein H310_02254 [Aphanomyces invadans]ETW07830.1 hypothetical protein H310_02254 [Aphanomyces invadans]|eukprot:XP_008863923.1 hypothetical protein H310_02254 [Aphanomyces invadans]
MSQPATTVRREKVEVVFSTKTKVPTSVRKEDSTPSHELHTSTGSVNSRQDSSEQLHQASGEPNYGQMTREGSSEVEAAPASADNSIRKRGRRSSRKGSSSSDTKVACKVSASVRRLRPSKALLQLESASVAECVKAMVDSRTEATLVTDSKGSLTGILTDKDIALRVVARGLDPISTIALDVMTPNPSCVSPRACAIEALEQMVSGQFRHLPVADNGSVVGILDIAKCLYDAISKIENAYMASSSQFSESMQKLDANIGDKEASLFEKMRETLFLPTLSSLIDGRADVPEIVDTATARDASLLMLETNSSAVMVFGEAGIMEGICTTKDLMRRVLAAGLDPETCLVRDIMTVKPEYAHLNTTILDALHSMHDGKFLHLPILNDDGVVVGLADVLQVTCGVVHHMGSFQQQHTANVNPVWNQFWNSMFNPPTTPSASSPSSREAAAAPPIGTASHASATSSASSFPRYDHDSATFAPPLELPAAPLTFAYKLTDLVHHTHRFTATATDLAELLQQVRDRTGLLHEDVNLYYVDDENDTVLLFADQDLKDAVALATEHSAAYLRLKVQPAAAVADKETDDSLEDLPNLEAPRTDRPALSDSMMLKIRQGSLVTALTMTVVGTAMMLAKRK